MKTIREHFQSLRNRKESENHVTQKKNPPSSMSLKKVYRTQTPIEASTPETPPSPFSTVSYNGGLTPPSPETLTPPQPFNTKENENNDRNMNIRTPPSPSMTPQNIKRIKIETKPSKTTKTKQLYLDLGQSSFASRTICNVCNMLCVHGVKEDEENHKKVCNEYLYGVVFNMWKHARIVHEANMCHSSIGIGSNVAQSFLPGNISNTTRANGCIVEIRESDSIQLRRKVLQVKSIVDQELGFCSLSTSDVNVGKNITSDQNVCSIENKRLNSEPKSGSLLGGKTVYMYVENKRVVGFCTVESIATAFQMQSSDELVGRDESTSSRSMHTSKAMMGVHQLWCHRSHRKKHIATTLVDTARSKMIYGFTIPSNMVAFSSPTSDGARFARMYAKTDNPLVYDCR